MLSPGLSTPQRRAGATFCLAGAAAPGSLARTVSVPSAPGGHPISIQHTALLVSRWHCRILLKGSFPSHQQPRRPPWGRRGSAKGPLRAHYQQALNGATDTCPRLTREAQPNACYRAAVCLLSGSGVQHGSGGQQSQPVVTGAVPSLWPRPHILPYPGSRPGSRGNRSDSVTRPGPRVMRVSLLDRKVMPNS